MHISAFKNSKYLSRQDCGKGILVTVDKIVQEDLSMEGQAPELKWIMYFAEPESKPFVVNSTNAVLIAAALGSEETDTWQGRQIVLFDDLTVMMHGRAVGGIRARAPKNQKPQAPAPKTAGVPAPKPRPAPEPEPVMPDESESDVPF